MSWPIHYSKLRRLAWRSLHPVWWKPLRVVVVPLSDADRWYLAERDRLMRLVASGTIRSDPGNTR